MTALASLKYFAPELALIFTGFLVLILDLAVKTKRGLGVLSLAGTLIALGIAVFQIQDGPLPLFYGLFFIDPLGVFFRILAIAILGVTILMALSHKGIPPSQEGELYALLPFIGVGLTLMACSANLLMIYIAVEFVSLTSYILAGFQKKDLASNEASVKYLLFGSVASAILLYGMSLIFGITGTLDLFEINFMLLARAGGSAAILLIGASMIFAGISFKIAAAPFHMWAPDVYTGAPTPIAGFLTVGPKALGFVLLLRFLFTAFPIIEKESTLLFAVLSALTMTIGNVLAVSQTNIKRLLAYSSIAQAGYILMGIAAANEIGREGILFYAAAYALTNLGAFTVVIVASNHFGNEDIPSYAGLAKRNPLLAAALTFYFVSLAGIPPIAGYFAKLLVFAGAIEKNLIALAVIAAVNSAVAVYYYFKILKEMYLKEPSASGPISIPVPARIALLVTLAGVILLGLAPSPLLHWAERAVLS